MCKMLQTSIIIVTYNCADVISQCLQSCLNKSNSEIIVIDNASADSTLKQIERFENRITIVKNAINNGFTKACNQGIRLAQGKYILLLNPDAWLEKNSTSELVDLLDNNDNIGAVAPVLKYPDHTIQNYTRTFPTVTGLFVESFIPMKWWNKFKAYRDYTCQEHDFTLVQEVQQPAGAALLFRKKWVLDENYFIYGSDVDLCRCIIGDGYKIVQTPKAVVYHHQSKGGTENSKLRLYLDLDNYYGMRYYFKKHKEYVKLMGYVITFFFALTIRFLFSIALGKKDVEYRYKKLKGFLMNKNFQYGR